MKTAILITIGDEILSGTTLDTNSNFIAEQLKSIGIKVQEIRTISDEVVAIENAFLWAMESTDIVVATGGLGPTKDDKTKKVLAKVFQDNLLLDALTFQHLKNYLKEKNRLDILEINYTQAEIPSKAKVFQNEYGTAPALMMEKNEKIIFCLPGVPYEVKPLMKDKIIPYLRKQFATEFILSKTISVVDVAESILSQNIESWEINLPKNMQLSYLPIANRIKLKLTATGVEKNEVEKQLQQQIHLLKPLIIENVISWDGDKIEEILQQILLQKKWTLSVAESCTGGELSKLITSVSGSSAYFLGGVIAYDYHKKIQILNVNAETIAQKTVVSEEVAREMALGSQQLFASDIAISTTGVAGPNSDAFNNQVGKVYYTIRIKEFEKTFSLFLPHVERKDFMNFVAMKTLQDLIKCIQLFEKI
jgi:nicotinamide-nucleotide amidase